MFPGGWLKVPSQGGDSQSSFASAGAVHGKLYKREMRGRRVHQLRSGLYGSQMALNNHSWKAVKCTYKCSIMGKYLHDREK